MNRLWYTCPPKEYMSGLPIGTGRLAAMVMGTPRDERVALNHEWLWRGVNRNREPDKAAHLLPEVRRTILAGRYDEGVIKGNDAFGCGHAPDGSRQGGQVDPYQPAGDFRFRLSHGAVSNYRRELDIDKAAVAVTYTADGLRFKREYIAHIDCNLVLVRLSANGPFNGRFRLSRTEDDDCFLQFETREDALIMDGEFERGLGFQVRADLLKHDGRVRRARGALVVEDATEVLFSLNVGTSAKGQPPASECREHKVPTTNWQTLVRSHRAAYRRFCGGLTFTVDAPEPRRPTDERIRAMRMGKGDAALPVLYFHYGRYLLVCCTATAELPPNLQGKWNEDVKPPWDCDYHHDVNLQMNYWPAEAAALPYTTEALFQHIERCTPHGRKAARDLYGCRGVWFPITTDAWGRCTPDAYGWAVWIGAAPWLAQHLWWHYEFGQDLEFLRRRAYPFFREVAAFYESYLIEDKKGVLQIVPSQSPENRFVGGGGHVSLCVSATMDVQLARDALSYAQRSAELLEVDPDKRKMWKRLLKRLPPYRIGRHGQLQEWNEDFEEVEPQHRHLSHLIGVYPGDSITPEKTPELWEAARVSLDRRLSAGGGHTGWSRSWVSCLYARFGDAEKAWEHLNHLIGDFATDSLLDIHPPRIFQIDGNFGGTAAVLDMLLQSYHETLHFLPALPAAWPSGSVTGLRARGGFTVGITWKDGRLRSAMVRALKDRECVMVYSGGKLVVKDSRGKTIRTRRDGQKRCFKVKGGKTYRITCPA